MRFQEAVGLVRYAPNLSTAWRSAHDLSVCEMNDCGKGEPLCVDHCHVHGWVRGVLCVSHNVRLGHLESASSTPGIKVDLSGTEFGTYRLNCPECRNDLAAPSEFTYVGRPCVKGHIERYKSNNRCAGCSRIRNQRTNRDRQR